ncbi:MAG TPA: hypothetical protein PLZ98_04990 [Chitinophagaceae bacterium]|nr:hypothetical protein [Chitinophagaceae bacterium]
MKDWNVLYHYVLDCLKQKLPPYLTYHHWQHTLHVIEMSEFIAREENISNDDIRDLAKKSSWCNTWYTIKGVNVFNGVPSIEQQLLLMWSKIYDNIRDTPDGPSEELILDNDAIDGWLIIQREESDKKKAENTSKLKINSKINNAQEVFIVAKTKEEADRIQGMNSLNASRIQKQRLEQISSQGDVHHHNLTDVRMDIREQFHKMNVEHIRGK